jgi:hypothetical protein
MKRGMLAAAVATVLLGSSPSPAAAEADVRLENGSAEISGLYRGCDENIRYAGTLRFVYMNVSSAADMGFGNVHVNAANVSGVGETSGTSYRFVYVLGERSEGAPAEQFGGSYEMTFKIVGGGQIIGQKWVGRWTRTPNGDITVSFEEVKQDWVCSA